ncbi:MAG: hypothetical protein AAGE65_10750 [Planctomycetota bacterium]
MRPLLLPAVLSLVLSPLAVGPAAAETQTMAATPPPVTLDAEKLIEFATAKIAPGREQAFQTDYFQKLMPLLQEYGVRPIRIFPVTRTDHGPAGKYTLFGLFEWPDLATKQRFESDPRFVKLRQFRDTLMETPVTSVLTRVDETVTFTPKPGSVMEAAVVWINAEKAEHLPQYFQAAGPFIAENDVAFHGRFTVVGQPDNPEYAFDSQPDRFMLIEWGSAKVKQTWFNSEAFKRAGWHRALALDRLLVLESETPAGPMN